jgi:hypothetical protein
MRPRGLTGKLGRDDAFLKEASMNLSAIRERVKPPKPRLEHAGPELCGLPGACPLCDRIETARHERFHRRLKVQCARRGTTTAAKRMQLLLRQHPEILRHVIGPIEADLRDIAAAVVRLEARR